MKKIQLSAKFKIHQGKVDEFKKITDIAMAIVTEKEKGKTCLQYDWFLNSDETECVVRETYLDSNAFMTHLANVGEGLGQLLVISDLTVEIYGTISDEVKNATVPFNPKVYAFYKGLS